MLSCFPFLLSALYGPQEVEDKAFESCREDILKSIRLSKRYLDNFII